MKTVVILNGEIINVGEWDYQFIEIDGKNIARNPMPQGAIIEEREMEYSEEHGWREVGISVPPTEIELLKQRLIIAENTILDMILGGL